MAVEKFTLNDVAEQVKAQQSAAWKQQERINPKPAPKPRIPNLKAKPRELTDAELVRYLETKKVMGLDPITVDPQDPDPKNVERVTRVQSFAVVMDPKNPYLSFYREYIGGVITFAEMQSAIDHQLCSNQEALNAFRWKGEADKPEELDAAEFNLRKKVDGWSKEKKAEAFREFYITAKTGRFSEYFAAVQRIENENRTNLAFILEVYKRQTNETFKARLLAIIETHKRKGQLV